MKAKVVETTPLQLDWSAPAKYCPRCGGQQLTSFGEWDANSREDRDNTCTLTEYQCVGCKGASFWM